MFRNFALAGTLFATACAAELTEDPPAGETGEVSVQQEALSTRNPSCGNPTSVRAEATVRDTTLDGRWKRKSVGDSSNPLNNIYVEANAKPSGGKFIGDIDRNELAICNTQGSGLCVEGSVRAVVYCQPGRYDNAGTFYPDPGEGWDWTFGTSFGLLAPGECYQHWHMCPPESRLLAGGWASTTAEIQRWSGWLGE